MAGGTCAKKVALGTPSTEAIAILETQVDDLSPQVLAYLSQELLTLGAYDVFSQAITMKKSRQGILLTVHCPPALTATCRDRIFQETTTLGIRYRLEERFVLPRAIHALNTPYGPVRIKVCRRPLGDLAQGQPLTVQPEYEDCAAIARSHSIPLREVLELVHSLAITTLDFAGKR